MKPMFGVWAVLLVVLGAFYQLSAEDRIFTVATNAGIISHWPGLDGYLGTADDVIQNRLSQILESSPNSIGSYGYLATSLAGQHDDWLPEDTDTATFLQGTVTIDTASFLTNDIPMIKSLDVWGTELFPGHGPYTVRLTRPRDGLYSHKGLEYTFSTFFDFEGTFAAGLARSTNAHATGSVYLIESRDFAVDLPNPENLDPMKAWINGVALPLARQLKPNAILCGRVNTSTAASIPGTSGSFPPLNAYGTFIAMEAGSSGASTLRITRASLSSGDLLIEWSAVPGKAYRVDSSVSLTGTYQPQVLGLTETRFLDHSVTDARQRFYRIVAE